MQRQVTTKTGAADHKLIRIAGQADTPQSRKPPRHPELGRGAWRLVKKTAPSHLRGDRGDQNRDRRQKQPQIGDNQVRILPW